MIQLLGAFEDSAQKEFHLGVIESVAEESGLEVEIVPLLTAGCRPHVLVHFLEAAPDYDGMIIGVDGKKKGVSGKRTALGRAVGLDEYSTPVLMSVALPSVEEWMMADEEAFRDTLAEKLSIDPLPREPRPGGSRAERTAKKRLRQWTIALAGERLLDDGREYAREIGRRVDRNRIGSSRNADLYQLLHNELPAFLEHLEEDA